MPFQFTASQRWQDATEWQILCVLCQELSIMWQRQCWFCDSTTDNHRAVYLETADMMVELPCNCLTRFVKTWLHVVRMTCLQITICHHKPTKPRSLISLGSFVSAGFQKLKQRSLSDHLTWVSNCNTAMARSLTSWSTSWQEWQQQCSDCMSCIKEPYAVR